MPVVRVARRRVVVEQVRQVVVVTGRVRRQGGHVSGVEQVAHDVVEVRPPAPGGGAVQPEPGAGNALVTGWPTAWARWTWTVSRAVVVMPGGGRDAVPDAREGARWTRPARERDGRASCRPGSSRGRAGPRYPGQR